MVVMERAKAGLITTIPTERVATRVRATTNGLTTRGISGEQIITGTPKSLLITSGEITRARSTFISTQFRVTTAKTTVSNKEVLATRATRTLPAMSDMS